METVTQGTIEHPEGIAYKSTQKVMIFDKYENLVRQETRIVTGSSYAQVSFETIEYDETGRVVSIKRSDGTQTESEWGCCGKSYEMDARSMESLRYLYGYRYPRPNLHPLPYRCPHRR